VILQSGFDISKAWQLFYRKQRTLVSCVQLLLEDLYSNGTCKAEDNYCFIAPCKLLLPKDWRHENIRIRQKLADQEYPRLSGDNRKARILDDTLPQFSALVPTMNEILIQIKSLNTRSNDERAQYAARLEEDVRQCLTEFELLLVSKDVMEALEPVHSSSVPYRNRHENCCPAPPLTLYHMQFPPAGIVRMVIYTTLWYIQSVLYPAVRAQFDSPRTTTPFGRKDVSYYSSEICKTFAGLEEDFGDNPEAMIHLFPLLIVSTTNCSPEI
jgi:hypothetical protein